MSTPQNYIMMFSEILCKDFSNDESGNFEILLIGYKDNQICWFF